MSHLGETPPRGRRPHSSATSAAKGGETRSALLTAARRLFARGGYDGTSVRDITREAGANLGAVTYHFGSKRALYGAVIEDGISPVVARVGKAAASGGPPLDRLNQVVEVFFDQLASSPDLPRLMLQEMAAGKRPPPELTALVQQNLRHITGILAEGWEDGSLRPGHPTLTALSVISQIAYMTLMAPLIKEVGGLDLRDPRTRAMVTDHVKAFIRDGLTASQEKNV